jgi:hypothetical protein
MKNWHFLIPLIFLFGACQPKVENTISYKKFEADFLNKYKNYHIENRIKDPIDLIGAHVFGCNIDTSKNKGNYTIIQSYDIYIPSKLQPKKNIMYTDSSMSYELVHFKNPDTLDNVFRGIMDRNCLDNSAKILKINRIYKINAQTLICIYYYSFNTNGFEAFIKKEFGNDISIEIISTPSR